MWASLDYDRIAGFLTTDHLREKKREQERERMQEVIFAFYALISNSQTITSTVFVGKEPPVPAYAQVRGIKMCFLKEGLATIVDISFFFNISFFFFFF